MPERDTAERVLRIDLPIRNDDELTVLRGALLAARASELAEAHRRGFRHFAGYGSDSARTVMTAEVEHHQRRMDMLDRLIDAVTTSAERA
jgi:hypothetical protein